MKSIILTILTTLMLSIQVHAAAEDVGNGMLNKATRGFLNTTTGFLELPLQAYKGFDQGVSFIEAPVIPKPVGLCFGLFRGIFFSVGRTGSGVFDLATFWAAGPQHNMHVGIPLDAEYVWEKGRPYLILKKGIMPIFSKAGYGICNLLLGICELPGQIKAGYNSDFLIGGIFKGGWYTISRITTGAQQLGLFIFPNPIEEKGYPFDALMPYDALLE
jgi:putative exosortase-associated protein (TIGR04073 family)